MLKRARLLLVLLAGLAAPLRAAVWMTPEEAGRHWFPGEALAAETVPLSAAQQAQLKALLKPYATRGRPWVWPTELKVLTGKSGWLVCSDEIGKHRPIRFAVAVDQQGKVLVLDVLEYQENYGHEIRREAFRAQYHGKGWADPIRSAQDIDAISGATYSCYATDRAVRKALALLKLTGRLP
jgi:hypothetical protein